MPQTDRASHPRVRYVERYGAPLTKAELRVLEQRLGAGEGMLLRFNPDGTEVRVIRHGQRLVVAVYSKVSACIKTFLPADDAGLRARRLRA